MDVLNKVLLILHFIGLVMGVSASVSNIVMSVLISRAELGERPILARFPPAILRVGTVGLALLWVTGFALLYAKWEGFSMMPWTFHAKLTAVVLLTITIGIIHWLMRLAKKSDASSASRIQTFGKVAALFAVLALVFAVLTFE